MARNKSRSRYRPTRKGKGFGGCKRKQALVEKTLSEERDFDEAKPSTSSEKPETPVETPNSDDYEVQQISSSAKKMKLYCSSDGSLKRSYDDSVEHSEPTGYRLIDLKNLASLISLPYKCDEGTCQKYFLKHLDCICWCSRERL